MDKIIRATAADGLIKMAAITARDTVERARVIHGLSPTACAALGRTLCGASLLGQAMKEADASLTIRINGGGPIGSVVAVSDCAGNVRGYVDNPRCELPLREDGKLNVGGAVGRDGAAVNRFDPGFCFRQGGGICGNSGVLRGDDPVEGIQIRLQRVNAGLQRVQGRLEGVHNGRDWGWDGLGAA